MPHRDTLLNELAKYAYRRGEFMLASGEKSNEYLNCKEALSRPTALAALGHVIHEAMAPSVEAVGGLTMGADPLAISASLVSAARRPVGWFSVRKEPKKHGLQRLIEGSVGTGAKVAVVDDVVTTGGSTIEAITKCRDARLAIVQVIVLVDREQGGLERIKDAAAGVPVIALFTKSEVRHAWEQLQASRNTA
jgi:orotate phosphoribosyltransferase